MEKRFLIWMVCSNRGHDYFYDTYSLKGEAMERVVAIKINKVAVGMIVVGLVVQASVLTWLVWPRKVKN